jgi:hypothetical protein
MANQQLPQTGTVRWEVGVPGKTRRTVRVTKCCQAPEPLASAPERAAFLTTYRITCGACGATMAVLEYLDTPASRPPVGATDPRD